MDTPIRALPSELCVLAYVWPTAAHTGEKLERTTEETGGTRKVTFVRTLPDIGVTPDVATITIEYTRNADEYTTQRKVTSSSITDQPGDGIDVQTEAITTYEYLEDFAQDERFDNGAPEWAKVTRIKYPDHSWVRYKYEENTGWLNRIITPFKSSSSSDDDETKHDVTEIAYTAVGGGAAPNNVMLDEQARTETRKILGVEVEKRLYHYATSASPANGELDVTTMQQVRVKGGGWGHADNLETKITRNAHVPANVNTPTIDTSYAVVSPPDTKLELTATRTGSDGNFTISETTSRQNAFGAVESAVTEEEESATTASDVSALDSSGFGFGKLKSTTTLKGLSSEVVGAGGPAHGTRGPNAIEGEDGSKTEYTYTAAGWVRTSKFFPAKNDDTRYILTTRYYDALGNVIKKTRFGKKSGYPDLTITTTAEYDILSRAYKTTNAESKTTTHNYNHIHHVVTDKHEWEIVTTWPHGKKSEQTIFVDGRVKNNQDYFDHATQEKHDTMYGVEYDYGVSQTYGQWTKVSTNSGNDWVTTYVNHVGQKHRAERSGTSNVATVEFDSKARPFKATSLAGIVTRAAYNDDRNYATEAFVDKNDDGTYDDDSELKITRVHSIDSGKRLWTTTVHTENGANNSVSIGETAFTSFAVFNKLQNGGSVAETASDTSYTGNGNWTVTTEFADGSKRVESYVKGELDSVVDKDASDTAIKTVEFESDALFRIVKRSDRTGDTTFTLNNVGQIDKTELPDSRFYEIKARNQFLKPTSIQRFDGHLQAFDYGDKAQLTNSSGAGIYNHDQDTEDDRPVQIKLDTTAGPGTLQNPAKTRQTYYAATALPHVKTLADGTADEVTVSTRTYDGDLRLEKDAQPGVEIVPTWDSGNGDLTKLVYQEPGQSPTIDYRLGWDERQRLTHIGPQGSQIAYTYKRYNLIETESIPHAGLTLQYDYRDSDNRRKSMALKNGGTDLFAYEYVWDDAGRFQGIKIDDKFYYKQHYQSNSHLPKNVEYFDDGEGAANMTLTRNYESNTNRLDNFNFVHGSTTLFSSDLGYNNNDQITSNSTELYIPSLAGGRSLAWDYRYDGETAPSNGGSVNPTAVPNYPPVGNTDPPAAPSKVVAIPVTPTRIDLAWLDEDDLEEGFKIDRSNDGTTNWAEIATVAAGVTCYSDTGHAAGTTRHYRVRAVNGANRADDWTGDDDDPWDARWQVEEYSSSGGQTRDLDIQGNRGEVSFTTNSEAAEIIAYQAVAAAEDVNLLVQFELDNASERFGLVARGNFGAATTFGNGSSDTYLVADAGDGEIRLRRVDAGTSSNLTTAGSVTISASTKYWLRLLVVTAGDETDLKVKVWADGATEPGGWNLEATDDDASQLAAGSCGLYFMAPSSVASPNIHVDDFNVLVWAGYSDSASATTPTPPAALSTPKDHLAFANAKNGSNARPGDYYSYTYDGIGNRLTKQARSGFGDASDYTPNILNQVTDRDTPGVVHISGYAPADQTVLVDGQPTVRDGAYYYGVVEIDNSEGALVQVVMIRQIEATSEGPVCTDTYRTVRLPQGAESDNELTYDARGNLLSDSIYVYTWDLKNRLVEIKTGSGITDDDSKVRLVFEYDALDRRTQKEVYRWDGGWQPDETIKFVWDGWLLVAELDATDDLIRSYIWGIDKSGTLQGAGGIGGLLAVVDHTGQSPVTYWATCDHNGNVTGLVNAADGTVAAAYEYSPFGEVLTTDGDFASENPMRFSTKYFDAEVGLCYYGYRYYAPDTGRWLNRDPIAEEGGLNLYAFVANDPMNSMDPWGLEEWLWPNENGASLNPFTTLAFWWRNGLEGNRRGLLTGDTASSTAVLNGSLDAFADAVNGKGAAVDVDIAASRSTTPTGENRGLSVLGTFGSRWYDEKGNFRPVAQSNLQVDLARFRTKETRVFSDRTQVLETDTRFVGINVAADYSKSDPEHVEHIDGALMLINRLSPELKESLGLDGSLYGLNGQGGKSSAGVHLMRSSQTSTETFFLHGDQLVFKAEQGLFTADGHLEAYVLNKGRVGAGYGGFASVLSCGGEATYIFGSNGNTAWDLPVIGRHDPAGYGIKANLKGYYIGAGLSKGVIFDAGRSQTWSKFIPRKAYKGKAYLGGASGGVEHLTPADLAPLPWE